MVHIAVHNLFGQIWYVLSCILLRGRRDENLSKRIETVSHVVRRVPGMHRELQPYEPLVVLGQLLHISELEEHAVAPPFVVTPGVKHQAPHVSVRRRGRGRGERERGRCGEVSKKTSGRSVWRRRLIWYLRGKRSCKLWWRSIQCEKINNGCYGQKRIMTSSRAVNEVKLNAGRGELQCAPQNLLLSSSPKNHLFRC